jgi:hypothetical protein
MVRAEGLEPPRLSSREPKSRASTNSATPAKGASTPNGQPGGAAYISTNPLAHDKNMRSPRTSQPAGPRLSLGDLPGAPNRICDASCPPRSCRAAAFLSAPAPPVFAFRLGPAPRRHRTRALMASRPCVRAPEVSCRAPPEEVSATPIWGYQGAVPGPLLNPKCDKTTQRKATALRRHARRTGAGRASAAFRASLRK